MTSAKLGARARVWRSGSANIQTRANFMVESRKQCRLGNADRRAGLIDMALNTSFTVGDPRIWKSTCGDARKRGPARLAVSSYTGCEFIPTTRRLDLQRNAGEMNLPI